ncbi:MAG: type II toxin-antitoxin system RelE/ParE family toxin [Nostoc sp. DedQUE01]|nr:type II toxin-antitoxin system RelE/ParE family toxin [Nostoc sp. DedQUE11]MDZ8076751.1 type II toxin-antitoxin system RelE/ParE family toxin [Nostoc sp. DedQUE01]
MLFLQKQVRQDISEIIDYFVTKNINAGESFVEKFDKKCRYLATLPNVGRSYENIKVNLRGVPLYGYIILYRVIDNGIEIVRVVSGYRNIESLFAEPDE